MWRGAHGRLAAIVVLAGGLSSCAPTPALTPRRFSNAPEEREDDMPICGGTFDDRTPEQRRAEASLLIESAAMGCGLAAEREGRHGEARVTVSGDGSVSVSRRPRSGLTESDERCVSEATRVALGPAENWSGVYGRELVVDAAVGKSPPLFASAPKHVAQWLAAMRSKPARRRFAAQLQAEVVMKDDGCLSIPNRPAFTDGLERWIATVETPVSAYWQPDSDPSLRHRGDLFASMAAQQGSRAYLVGDSGLMLHHTRVTDPSQQELCLLPLDDHLRQDLKAGIDRRGACWVGDLRDILLHPRTEFRASRPLKSIAVGLTRTCGLDDGGAVVCCGERTDGDPPAGTYAGIAVGTDFDCGVTADGGLACWGHRPPGAGAVIPGPYAQVAVVEHEVCAIRRDTRALECWRAEQARMVTVARDKVRELALPHEGLCALLEDGRIFCRTFAKDARWSELRGAFRAIAASVRDLCAVTAPEGGQLRCWQDREHWPDWLPSPAPDRPRVTPVDQPTALAMSSSDGCVLGRSGHIACWRSPARARWDGLYSMLAGSTTRLCALTVAGRVECDREWPYLKE